MLTDKQRATHARPQACKLNEEDYSSRRYGSIVKVHENFYKDKRVADFGCSYGWGIRDTILPHTNKKIVGFEINKDAITVAVEELSDLDFEVLDLLNTGYPDKSFDIITCIEVIEHIDTEEIDLTLNEMYRLLPKGGQVYLTTPDKRHHNFPNGSHWMEYRKEEIQAMFEAKGFVFKKFLEKHIIGDGVSNGYLFQK